MGLTYFAVCFAQIADGLSINLFSNPSV